MNDSNTHHPPAVPQRQLGHQQYLIKPESREMTEREWVQAAIEEFFRSDFQPGDLIPNDWLKRELGATELDLTRVQQRFNYRRDSFIKRLLRDHCIDLQNEYDRGYRYLHPYEQARHGYEVFTRGMTAVFERTREIHHYVKRDQMTAAERRHHVDMEMRAASMRQMVTERVSKAAQAFTSFEEARKLPRKPIKF